MSLDVGVVLGIARSRLRRAIRVLVDESLMAMALDVVLLVLSALVALALVLHRVSFRPRAWVPTDQTGLQAPIFPLFRSERNSALSAGA